MAKPASWTRTARGIEIEQPRPGLVRRTLAWAGAGALGLAVVAVATTGEWRAPLWIAGFFLDRGVLAVCVPLLLVLLLLDRGSRERWIAGATTWVHETRIGPLVATRSEAPAPSPSAIEVRAARGGDWRVVHAQAGRPPSVVRLAEGLHEAGALALAQALREASHATTPVRAGPLHEEWPRIVLGLLGGRLASAIPIAVAGLGALLLATAWNLRGAQVEPVAAYDAMAEGELLRFRYVVREPDADEQALGWREGVATLELGVRWRTPDGVAREAWWTSGEPVMLSYLMESRLAPLAGLVGLPAVELALPARVRPLLGPADAAPSLLHLPENAPPSLEAAHALVAPLDDMLGLLAARSGASANDWRIAYRQADPAQATLAVLARIDAEAVATMPVALLVAAALVGALLLAGGLAVALDRAGPGAVLALAVMASVPWWAPHARTVAAWSGIEGGTAALLRDLAVRASSERAGEAGYQLQPAARPADDPDTVTLRLDPAELPAAPMLPILGLDAEGPAAGDFAQRRDALVARAAAHVAALDDAALVALIQRWQPEEFGRYSALRVPWIEGLCLARTQAARSGNTRRWIDAAIRTPVLCEQR